MSNTITVPTRTRDIHSPANIQPQDYEYLDSVWLGDPDKGPDNDPGVAKMIARSTYQGNFAAKNTCDHCGAWFLYGAAYLHVPSDDVLVERDTVELQVTHAMEPIQLWWLDDVIGVIMPMHEPILTTENKTALSAWLATGAK